MGFCYADRLKVVNTNPGTGNFSGGSGVVAGFQSFANAKLNGTGAVAANGDVIPYAAWDGGSLWEVGYATYTLSGVLLGRLAGNVTAGSSGAGALVVFSGSVTVWCDVPAKSAVVADNNGAVSINGDTSGNQFGVGTNQNSGGKVSITNSSGAAAAYAAFLANNNTGNFALVGCTSSGYGASGIILPNSALFQSSGSMAVFSGGVIQFAAGNSTTEVARVVNDGSPGVFVVGLGLSQKAIRVEHISGSASGTDFEFFTYNGTQIGGVSQNGTTGVLFNTTSDETLKNILVQQRDFGVIIDAVWVGDAAWKSDPEQTPNLMVTAQRTLKAGYGQAISKRPDGILQADYGQFAPLALWGVKELRPRVASLESRVAELEGLVKALLAKG